MAESGTGASRSRIFISYRREDAEHPASRLADDLRRHFGGERVSHDIGDIEPGADFVEVLRVALDTSAAVVVVIGRNWLTIADRKGRRRLDNPEDWVRIEVAESLKRSGVKVFPVLVDDADMPDNEDLPESLRPLTRRQAFPMTVRHWANDVAKLVASLRKVPGLADGDEPEAPRSSVGSAPAVQRPKAGAAPAKSSDPPAATETASRVHAPGTVFRDGDDCPEMVVIPAGEFMMGSPEAEEGRSDYEGPRHKAKIAKPFALGRYAVTLGEFRRFVDATGYKTEAETGKERGLRVWDAAMGEWSLARDRNWRNPGFEQDERHPVVGVTWNDAKAYVKWLCEKTRVSYRLPSEAEWEYAARARTKTRYPWGDEPGTNLANFDGSGSGWSDKRTAPVGSFKANRFDLHDMIGNVSEWTQDCWNGSYKGAPADGSAWESGDCGRRVVRGGSWDIQPEFARAAFRFGYGSGYRSADLGFRVARTL